MNMDTLTILPDLAEELQFYKKRLDKVSGEIIRMQYHVASLANEINQLRNGYRVILALQHSSVHSGSLSHILGQLLDFILQYAHMDRALILKTESPGKNFFVPFLIRGYPEDFTRDLKKHRIRIDPDDLILRRTEIFKRSGQGAGEMEPLSDLFNLPFFVSTPLLNGESEKMILITGRIYERKPMISYMPLSEADVFIFESIAGVIGSIDERMNQQLKIEEERNRISADMHDDIGSRLSTASVWCDITSNSIEGDQTLKNNLREIKNTVNEVIDNLGNIIWAIDPGNNTLANLVAYIHEYSGNYLELNGVELNFEEMSDFPELPVNPTARKNIFMVLKEALHNAVKYAGSPAVTIRMNFTGSQLCIEILDNGCGFERGRRFGNGLRNMKKRMDEISAEFKIVSGIGKGTALSIKYPLPDDNLRY